MIFESYQQFKSSGFKPTVCIIGSGPAGITLARQLEKQKIPSLIVEAGGLTYSTKSQDVYKGKISGDYYLGLDIVRLRYFGGTSGHWSGWCRPLDEVDFETRKHFPNSGWPINKSDLDPYAKETDSILEVGPFQENYNVTDDLEEAVFIFSDPPVRFGNKYREQIKKSSLISVLLNSPVKSIVPKEGRISNIEIESEGKIQHIESTYFSLCTGGIENSRLLLWSNVQHNGGVVPHAETLGKYWMEHPHHDIGQTLMFQPTGLNRDEAWMRVFSPTKQYLHNHGIGNFGIRFYPVPGTKKGLLHDAACTAANLISKLKYNALEPDVCTQQIIMSWGQTPTAENRIELSDEKDANGMPRVNLFWKKQAADRLTAQTAAKLFGAHLAKKDVGRLKIHDWLSNDLAYLEGPDHGHTFGFHHMGGTRMASSSEHGVVDKNCKVFGIDNLFIGGSSVFTTGGHANPTYTIVQLALRLGDHIANLEKTSVT